MKSLWFRCAKNCGCLLSFLVFAAFFSCDAQGQKRQGDRIVDAEQILRVFYPELFRRKLSLKVRDDAPLNADGISNWFSLEVSEPWVAGTSRKCDTPDVLSAYFQFARHPGYGPIHMIQFGGPAAHSDELESFREKIDVDPQLSDEQVLKLLKDSGAKYLPPEQEELLAKVPLKGMGKFLGRIKVDLVRFDVRNAVQLKESLPAADVIWTIYFTAERPNGEKTKYFLVLEPFEGKVQSLERVPLA